MTHSDIERQDIIDLYLLGRLTPELQAEFEEHFLTCRDCVAKLEANKENIAAIQEAFAGQEEGRSPAGWRFLIPLPAWGLAAAVATLAVYLTIVDRATPPPPRVESQRVAQRSSPEELPVVELQSYRAARSGGATIKAATAAKPFLLRLDLRGVNSYPKYLLRVAGDSGEPVWSANGIPQPGGDWLEVKVEGAAPAPGGFWVRLFGVGAGGQTHFLREYSLVVEP